MSDECRCGYPIPYTNHDQCRTCRNPGRSYVSPDRAERNSEALDQMEMEARARIVENASNDN